ncbi:MAG: MMPL family transporter [Pseudomonadota bacterium]
MRLKTILPLVLAYGLLGMLALVTARAVNMTTDLSFVFPENASSDTALLMNRLQEGPSAGVIIIGISGAALDEIAELSNRLATHLIESGQFDFVSNGSVTSPREGLGRLFSKRYLLNPAVTPSEFESGLLADSLSQNLLDLTTASGSARKDLLAADPTNRTEKILRYWSGARNWGGLWLSADGKTALLTARSAQQAMDLDHQAATIELIERTFLEAKGTSAATLEMTGPSVFAARTSEVIRGDIQNLTIASSIVVALLILLAFRSIKLVFAMVLPLGFGLCVAALAVQLLFGEIHGITLAFGGTLIGVAVDYPLHLMSHSRPEKGPSEAIKLIWRTLLLGVATTVIAFSPMTWSSFPGMAQLGVFAISGLIASACFTRFILPALIPGATAPSAQSWSRVKLPKSWRMPLRVGSGLLALAALTYLWSQGPALWENDLRNLSPTSPEMRALDRELRHELGEGDVRFLLVVRQDDQEQVLQRIEALTPGLQSLIEDGHLVGFDAPTKFLPSAASQSRRQEFLPDEGQLQQSLETALEGLPFVAGFFQPFLEGVQENKKGPFVMSQDFRATGLDSQLNALLFPHDKSWVGLIVPISLENPEALQDFAAANQISYLDLKEGSEELVAGYRQEAGLWLGAGVLLAILLLAAVLRSASRLVRVVIPICLSLLFTITLLSLFGAAFSLFHLLSILLVGGIGLDYALFFNRIGDGEDSRLRTLRANVFCAMTSVAVFSILALSAIPVLHSIGATVSVGAALSLLFAFLFSPMDSSTA